MRKVIDPIENWPVSFERKKADSQLLYYASDLVESLMIEDREELQFAIKRAFKACTALRISVRDNFKSVIRFDGVNLLEDWKISSLASYLIIINANPLNPNVAKAQLYYIYKKMSDV